MWCLRLIQPRCGFGWESKKKDPCKQGRKWRTLLSSRVPYTDVTRECNCDLLVSYVSLRAYSTSLGQRVRGVPVRVRHPSVRSSVCGPVLPEAVHAISAAHALLLRCRRSHPDERLGIHIRFQCFGGDDDEADDVDCKKNPHPEPYPLSRRTLLLAWG